MGEMNATMADINGDAAVNPDAQSAVTDFLDYTEYLPTDLIRSLTLIRQLDEIYLSNSCVIHELAQTYGRLPSLPSNGRPDALKLRSTISHHLDLAISARESAYAEAVRLFDVTDRHQDRLKSIIAKLHALPKPPSRDPTPQPQPQPSAKQQRSAKKPEPTPSTRRLTLKAPKSSANSAILHRPRPRPRHRRVTVPGEVLPPFDPDEPLASTEHSDWESNPPSPVKPVAIPPPIQPKPPPKQRAATESERKYSHPRENTTYHKPTPPPEDAPIGSKYHPWTHLSEYEMYRLRKKMKKNNTWEPSEIMVRRELAEKGRGWDNYYKARAAAQANGTPFIDIDDKKAQNTPVAKPEVPKPAPPVAAPAVATPQPAVLSTPIIPKTDVPARPKVLKRSESKKEKEKRDETPRDAASKAAQEKAAQEAEAAARQLGAITTSLKNLFGPLSVTSALDRVRTIATPSSTPTPKIEKKPVKKRKLEDATSASPSIEPEAQQKKKQKLLPKPVPIAPAEPVPVPPAPLAVAPSAGTIKIPLKLNVSSPTNPPAPVSTPPVAAPRPVSAHRTVPSVGKPEVSPPASRPPSRRSAAASVEPPIVPSSRPSRRTSVTPAAPTRKTPALETTPKMTMTAASRRSKREAPGTVTQSSQDGGAAVSVSKRKHKPSKTNRGKILADSAKPELRTDVDGNQELLDPDEERYCICGDVSYGNMICCELDEKVGVVAFALREPADD